MGVCGQGGGAVQRWAAVGWGGGWVLSTAHIRRPSDSEALLSFAAMSWLLLLLLLQDEQHQQLHGQFRCQ